MEIASDELITESEREQARQFLSEQIAELGDKIARAEAKILARAVFHSAVTVSARTTAENIADQSENVSREVVAEMLRDPGNHPHVESTITEICRPQAVVTTIQTIKSKCEDKSIPLAEDSISEIITSHFEKDCSPVILSILLSNMQSILQSEISKNPQLSASKRKKLLDEYFRKQAAETVEKNLKKNINPVLLRKSQKAAERIIEAHAAEACVQLDKTEVLTAIRAIAHDATRVEISRVVIAEAQRRAAKLTRERLQEEVAKQSDDKRAEFCNEEARRIADEVIAAVSAEISQSSISGVDMEEASKLVHSATAAIAREFSGAYQLTSAFQQITGAYKVVKSEPGTMIPLILVLVLAMAISWFFLFGGTELCRPFLKDLLPTSTYELFYGASPAEQSSPEDELEAGNNEENGLHQASPEVYSGAGTQGIDSLKGEEVLETDPSKMPAGETDKPKESPQP